MNPLELKVRSSYYVRLVIVGVLTVGLGFLIMGFEFLRWARTFDDSGVTRRDGRKFLWGDLKEKRYVRMRINGALDPLNNIDLIFNNGKVSVFPLMLENAGEAMAYIEKLPGQKVA